MTADKKAGRMLPQWLERLLMAVAACTSLFYLYSIYRGQFHPAIQRHVILAVALVFLFLEIPVSRRLKPVISWVVDLGLVALTIVSIVHLTVNELAKGLTYHPPKMAELVLGGILIILVLEGGRRALGWPVVILAIGSLLYATYGNHAPGLLRHPGFTWSHIVDHMSLGTFGIFGMPMAVASTIIIAFVIFAAFLRHSGASEVFFRLPMAMVGHLRGGPAKLAVVASALFGTISGSPTSNVVSTGSLTIPMMKRTGLAGHEAGAIEATASTGGIFMPPVMGAVAFLMADILGMPYSQIIVASALPAVLYYIGLFVMVDQLAASRGLGGLPRSELPPFGEQLRSGWIYFIPLLVLVYRLMVIRGSATRAALWATVVLLAVGVLLERRDRMDLRKIWASLVEGTRDTIGIVAVCAVAGIIIGTISMTGLAAQLSALLTELAGGNLFILLLLAAVTCIILGMGLPTGAAYLFLAILIAPAIVQLGVDPIAAHLFLVYFASLACFTPPVAVAAFAAAPIAQSPPFKIGLTAMKYGAIGYIIPFFFVYDSVLLLRGEPAEVVVAVITAILGTVAFAYALGGHFQGKGHYGLRLFLGFGSVLLIHPGQLTNFFGLACLLAVFAIFRIQRKDLTEGQLTEGSPVGDSNTVGGRTHG